MSVPNSFNMDATLRITSFLDIVNKYQSQLLAKGREGTYSIYFNKRVVSDRFKTYINRLTPYFHQRSFFATKMLKNKVLWTIKLNNGLCKSWLIPRYFHESIVTCQHSPWENGCPCPILARIQSSVTVEIVFLSSQPFTNSQSHSLAIVEPANCKSLFSCQTSDNLMEHG
jgi:hypothetical protein